MTAWLGRTTDLLSPERQNEIIELLSQSVQREIVHAVTTSSKQFVVIVDGTQDCSGTEQESICLRYVDNHLLVYEVFVGLYSQPNTTGQTLAALVTDVLTRLAILIDNLRGQTYHGAANMAGRFNGCQAIITSQYLFSIFSTVLHIVRIFQSKVRLTLLLPYVMLYPLLMSLVYYKNDLESSSIFLIVRLTYIIHPRPSNPSVQPVGKAILSQRSQFVTSWKQFSLALKK